MRNVMLLVKEEPYRLDSWRWSWLWYIQQYRWRLISPGASQEKWGQGGGAKAMNSWHLHTSCSLTEHKCKAVSPAHRRTENDGVGNGERHSCLLCGRSKWQNASGQLWLRIGKCGLGAIQTFFKPLSCHRVNTWRANKNTLWHGDNEKTIFDYTLSTRRV